MSRLLAVIGILISIAYLFFVYTIVGDPVPQLRVLELNELGDFFAGVFGPLAILWLVLGFFQQGMELRQNNEALNLQAQELRASVTQQVAMVEAQKVELSNYDKSLVPLLKVEPEHFSEIEGVQHLLIRVSNFGEYCEKIEVFLGDATYPSSIDALFKGDSKRVFIDVDGLDLRCVHRLKIKYIGRNGLEGGQEFQVREHHDEDGDEVYISKLPFLLGQ